MSGDGLVGAMSLVADGLTVRFRRHGPPILADVSFAVPPGSILAVAGPSGSGKSTLLAAVAGLVRPSAGRIEVAGIPVGRARHLARMVGHVGGPSAVEDELTPAEHLRFHASLRGIGRGQRDGLVAGLIELVDLGDWAHVPGLLLTPGLRRRLSIARALVHDPTVVLLDDPTAGLDGGARADLVDLVGGLADAGRTVVLAGGDLDGFAGIVTDLLILDRGSVEAVGPVESVLGSADGSRQVRVRLADGSEQFYDVNSAEEQRRLLARLVADGAVTGGLGVDEVSVVDGDLDSRLAARMAARLATRSTSPLAAGVRT